MYAAGGMNISICCEIVVAVAQPGLNIFERVAQIQHNSGTAVPQIVKAYGAEVIFFQYLGKFVSDIIGLN